MIKSEQTVSSRTSGRFSNTPSAEANRKSCRRFTKKLDGHSGMTNLWLRTQGFCGQIPVEQTCSPASKRPVGIRLLRDTLLAWTVV